MNANSDDDDDAWLIFLLVRRLHGRKKSMPNRQYEKVLNFYQEKDERCHANQLAE